ncbi:MAG: MBL fold metallo-hydrolase [Thermoproteales archaeon]|nr:MBL fold metallo-hydrolase [Thermoproteales archaeon]
MVKKLKITILVDNKPAPGFMNDWGFSAFIEADEHKILFDADTNPKVVKYNIEKLKIDISKTEFAVLSHHHHDHYGGFEYIGKIIPGLKLYVPPGSVEMYRRWSLEPIVNERTKEVLKDIYIIGPLEAWENFYEEAIAVKVDGKGIVLIVGCSHPGADNLAFEARNKIGQDIYHILGGFHKPSRTVIDNLAKFSKHISPAHCSGDEAQEYTKRIYPDKFYDLRTGTILEY